MGLHTRMLVQQIEIKIKKDQLFCFVRTKATK